MVERPDLVLAAIPALALAGPAAVGVAQLVESIAGVGGAVAALPLTPVGLVGALLVVLAATVWAPPTGTDADRGKNP